MLAWTVYCCCVILYATLQSGQAERIPGNDLLDDYDDDLDGLETGIWTENNSTKSGTEVLTDENQTPSGTILYTADYSTSPRTSVWTDNSTKIRTDGSTDTDDNSNRLNTSVPTNNNVTQSETDAPTDNKVTRLVTDNTTDIHKESSKPTTPIVERSTGVQTTRLPITAPPDICKNSSCPDLLILTTTVSEGGNITLRCGSESVNTSQIWWYRDSTVLEGVGNAVLSIVDSERSHSGSYLCADQHGCCIVQHHLFVYHVPPYAYHLAVMGAILAVGIPFCVFLSVRQSTRLGRYARMFNERHGEEKHLIW